MSTPAAAAAATRLFDVEAFTYLGVASCMTIFRTYIRATSVGGLKALQLDDYFVWLGTVRLTCPDTRLASSITPVSIGGKSTKIIKWTNGERGVLLDDGRCCLMASIMIAC